MKKIKKSLLHNIFLFAEQLNCAKWLRFIFLNIVLGVSIAYCGNISVEQVRLIQNSKESLISEFTKRSFLIEQRDSLDQFTFSKRSIYDFTVRVIVIQERDSMDRLRYSRRYGYDFMGRLLAVEERDSMDRLRCSMRYGYDLMGRLLTIKERDSMDRLIHSSTCEYDFMGRLSFITTRYSYSEGSSDYSVHYLNDSKDTFFSADKNASSQDSLDLARLIRSNDCFVSSDVFPKEYYFWFQPSYINQFLFIDSVTCYLSQMSIAQRFLEVGILSSHRITMPIYQAELCLDDVNMISTPNLFKNTDYEKRFFKRFFNFFSLWPSRLDLPSCFPICFNCEVRYCLHTRAKACNRVFA